jgi:hypothetical protein
LRQGAVVHRLDHLSRTSGPAFSQGDRSKRTKKENKMDDVKVEKTPTSTHTTINRTVTPPSGGGSMLWFVVGGLVVAMVVVGYFIMGNGVPTTTSTEPSGGNVSVNVETTPEPAAEATPEAAVEATPEPAPEAAPAEAAPEPALPVE